MVGPHEGELDAIAVGCLEETLVNRAIQKRAVGVVIPIKDEGIYPVVGGGGDLLGHDLRIRFVLITPERDLGLLMAGETGFGGFDEFPFAPGFASGFQIAQIVGMILAEVVTGDGDGTGFG